MFKGKNVAVLGGEGMIGKELVEQLIESYEFGPVLHNFMGNDSGTGNLLYPAENWNHGDWLITVEGVEGICCDGGSEGNGFSGILIWGEDIYFLFFFVFYWL